MEKIVICQCCNLSLVVISDFEPPKKGQNLCPECWGKTFFDCDGACGETLRIKELAKAAKIGNETVCRVCADEYYADDMD